eukprot:NODE_387_length_2820_cov_59.897664_g332_i0.p1 GENE.NODE_387_length_2820_cov_59.897664_g332_i0~~NODE_387_length_2820_cov_59.897664_g332_i0.p1  ORF type:complete len:881 (+),score=134.76 NODE_387_length_2820_cov_59.897664_g332_i0:47-2644(+)
MGQKQDEQGEFKRGSLNVQWEKPSPDCPSSSPQTLGDMLRQYSINRKKSSSLHVTPTTSGNHLEVPGMNRKISFALPSPTINVARDRTSQRTMSSDTDKVVLESESDKEEEEEAWGSALELYYTEQTYVKNMMLLLEEYQKPLAESNLLKSCVIATIFSNVDQIVELHKGFLSSLEKVVLQSSTQLDIGELLQNFFPSMRTTYVTYITGFDEATSTLDREMLKTSVRNFLNGIHHSGASNGLSITDLLIMPVQRVARYPLMLKGLLGEVPNDHQCYGKVQESLTISTALAERVNQSIHKRDQFQTLIAINETLTVEDPAYPSFQLLQSDRYLVYEGDLTKVCRRADKTFHFYLFNDVLLYVSSRNVSRHVFYLSECKFIPMDDTCRLTHSWVIEGQSKSFVVYADSDELKQKWLQYIEKLKGKTRETIGGPTAAVWAPDNAYFECATCSCPFTLVRRRHHCRNCGHVVCGSCSAHNFFLPNMGSAVRVCNSCFRKLSNDALTQTVEYDSEDEIPDERIAQRPRSNLPPEYNSAKFLNINDEDDSPPARVPRVSFKRTVTSSKISPENRRSRSCPSVSPNRQSGFSSPRKSGTIVATQNKTLLEIQESFIGLKRVEVVQAGRRLIKQGTLTKLCDFNVFKPLHFFVFNDCIIYAKSIADSGKYWFQRKLGYTRALADVADGAETAFRLISKEKSFVVLADTLHEKQLWLEAIAAMDKPQEDRTSHLVSEAPVWQYEGDKCSHCSSYFTITKRRHHCRSCGGQFCNNCTLKRAFVSNSGVKERVCDACFNRVREATRQRTTSNWRKGDDKKCRVCNAAFGIFRPSRECPNCSFLVCSSCFQKRMLVKHINPNTLINVCTPCYTSSFT